MPLFGEASSPFAGYAALTAAAFDADFQLVAISGRGVVRNYGGEQAIHMPALIDAALPDHPEFVWDQRQFKPDLVVVHLGTNDFSTALPGPDFVPAYISLLKALHERYPKAHLVSAYGPEDKTAAIPAIKEAVANYNATRSGAAEFVYLPPATSGRIFGCDWHPGLDTDKAMAAALIAKVSTLKGWRSADQ